MNRKHRLSFLFSDGHTILSKSGPLIPLLQPCSFLSSMPCVLKEWSTTCRGINTAESKVSPTLLGVWPLNIYVNYFKNTMLHMNSEIKISSYKRNLKLLHMIKDHLFIWVPSCGTLYQYA